MNETIRTTRTALAAFLVARGFPPIGLRQVTSREREFEFAGTPEVAAALEDFYANAPIPVTTYNQALSTVRELVHRPLPQNGTLRLGGRS